MQVLCSRLTRSYQPNKAPISQILAWFPLKIFAEHSDKNLTEVDKAALASIIPATDFTNDLVVEDLQLSNCDGNTSLSTRRITGKCLWVVHIRLQNYLTAAHTRYSHLQAAFVMILRLHNTSSGHCLLLSAFRNIVWGMES